MIGEERDASPEGKVVNSGARDSGVLLRFDHAVGAGLLRAGAQSDFGREIGRPRDNSAAVRFFYPREDSHRFTLGWERSAPEGWTRLGASAFAGRYSVVTDQDRAAAGGRPRTVERADVSADDFQARAYAERGVKEGDLVTIALPNGAEHFAATLACWRLGATPQPVSARPRSCARSRPVPSHRAGSARA